MSASSRAPKTMEQLRVALRFRNTSSVQEFIESDPVWEAFLRYSNRCFSSGSTTLMLPDWKDVDEYIQDMQTSRGVWRRGITLEQAVERDCTAAPYDLLPHASMFLLRIVAFLETEEGRMYDIRPEGHLMMSYEDVEFDRYIRIMNLLNFLVNRNREMGGVRVIKLDREGRQKKLDMD